MQRVYEKKNFTVAELAEEFQVSYRTMLRYLQELSGMGVPLYSVTGKRGGYNLLTKIAAKQVTKVIKPSTYVIGMEFKAPFTALYMAQVHIPSIWRTFNERIDEVLNVANRTNRIGVAFGRSSIYHYVAGVEVTSRSRRIPHGMVEIALPPREYAVYNHAGEAGRAEMDETYFLVLQKLRRQGLNHDPDACTLEVFRSGNGRERAVHLPLKQT
ncbi:HTH domain-containing protein [Paenibacillus sp. J5C_2022]|nr:HTH domain-containing protein [Paenibacillus sp. J5C2022]